MKKLKSDKFQCLICNTNEQFDKAKSLENHHQNSHTIYELSETLISVQKFLKSVKLLDNFLSEIQQKYEDDSNFDIEFHEEIPKPTEKKYQCPICQKVLSCQGNLTKHMIIHDPKKKFECPDCDAKFNQKRDLKTHQMQKHTGERPYKCKDCGKGFVHKHYLTEHMSYHTGERKYQCPQCGKRFQSASTLTKHSERHKGQRNHKCTQCSKSFLVHVDLRSHVRLVHEKPALFKNSERFVQNVESLTLTNLDNRSHTMLVIPSTSKE